MTQTYFISFLVNQILVKDLEETSKVSRSISNYWHLWIYDYPSNKKFL